MDTTSVGIAMSGGVDSTATALLMREHYTVTGFFMQLAQPDIEDQKIRVTAIAKQLGIALKIIDLSKPFEKCVLDYFCNSYSSGNTPNPCVVCNYTIKFGLFQDAILNEGMDKMATGHYARIAHYEGAYRLLKGVDASKDQSYFLSRLRQEQLERILFPLGNQRKSETYDLVEQHGFHTFRGIESQDVCFLADGDVAGFLKKRTSTKKGAIIDLQGKVLGRHNGIANYTIGQRRGLGISDSTPYYVIRLDADTNSVIIGKQEDLLRRDITVDNLHFPAPRTIKGSCSYTVKIRSTHRGSTAKLLPLDTGRYLFRFDEPQRAVTPGQFAVAYDGDEVVCCGEISDPFSNT